MNAAIFYLGALLVIFGVGFFVAWHALDPKASRSQGTAVAALRDR